MSFNPFANKADLEAAQSQIASLNGDLTSLQSELQAERELTATNAQSIADLQAQLTEAQAQVQSAKEEFDAKVIELDALNLQLAENEKTAGEKLTESEGSAAKKAAEILASAGVPAVDVQAGEKSKSNQVTRAEFNGMSDKQKMAFAKNKGTITN